MKEITLQVLKVEQPIGEFYVATISYDNLLLMSKVDRRHIENDDEVLGVQRELRKEKVAQIQKYLTSIYATFPNSIIVNTTSKHVVSNTDSKLVLRVTDSTFTIIDGQHRVAGFNDFSGNRFDLILTIFIDLNLEQQAEIFSTINSEQTKVDPSLNINLDLDSHEYTPRKMIVEIAQSFQYDKESPWFNRIKMLGGKDDGIISLAAFCRPLFDLTYPESEWYRIKNELTNSKPNFPSFSSGFDFKAERYLFWEFYVKQDKSTIYKILDNYFKAICNILSDDWYSPDSILCKTTGYNAILRLFRDMVRVGLKQKSLSYNFFFKELSPLKVLAGNITAATFGSSGSYSTNMFYREIVRLLPNIFD